MKIGIDGTPLTTPYPTGTRNYAENLLKSLAEIDKINQYIVFSPSEVRIPKQKNFKIIHIPQIPFLKKQLLLPLAVYSHKIDVFHFLEPFGSMFLRHPKIITTVHDVNLTYTYPYLSRHFTNRIYCEITRFMLAIHTKIFITDSATIADELRHYLKLFKFGFKIKTIYLAADTIFNVTKPNINKKKFILCMGDFAKRKNLPVVIKAYSELPKNIRNNYSLKIVVSTRKTALKFNKIIRKYTDSINIKVVVGLSNFQLRKLYMSAVVFIYPSLYEGFGLPIIEAMGCGCPVITANFGVMREIAGKSALLTDVRSSYNIENSILRILTNSKIRNSLIKKGLKRANEFNWVSTAKKTLMTYEKINKSI